MANRWLGIKSIFPYARVLQMQYRDRCDRLRDIHDNSSVATPNTYKVNCPTRREDK